jgi:hypothetical protein
MSPEPVVAWKPVVGRPTLTEKKGTTTKPRTATPDYLLLRIKPRITQPARTKRGRGPTPCTAVVAESNGRRLPQQSLPHRTKRGMNIFLTYKNILIRSC